MRCIHRPVLWLLHFNPFIHELYITTHVEPPPLYCCIVTDNFAEGISEILQTIKEIKNEHSHVNYVKLTCPENSDENPVPLPMATRTFLKIISWYLGEKKIQVKKRKKQEWKIVKGESQGAVTLYNHNNLNILPCMHAKLWKLWLRIINRSPLYTAILVLVWLHSEQKMAQLAPNCVVFFFLQRENGLK